MRFTSVLRGALETIQAKKGTRNNPPRSFLANNRGNRLHK